MTFEPGFCLVHFIPEGGGGGGGGGGCSHPITQNINSYCCCFFNDYGKYVNEISIIFSHNWNPPPRNITYGHIIFLIYDILVGKPALPGVMAT